MYKLISEAKMGNTKSMEEITRNNEGLVWSIVKRFAGRGYEAEDLYQIGMIGLIKAVRRFDTSYDVRFSTYAVPVITGEIKRFLRDDGLIKVSRRYKELYAKAVAVEKRLSQEDMSPPSIGRIAEELGVDIYTLTEAIESAAAPDSIYKTISEEGKGEMFLIDKLKGDSGNFFDSVSLNMALSRLTPKEKSVIAYRYFMDETQVTVAKRLGISQVQVSRIEKKALTALKGLLN